MSASWTCGFDRPANSDLRVPGFTRNQPRMQPVRWSGVLQSAESRLCGNPFHASNDWSWPVASLNGRCPEGRPYTRGKFNGSDIASDRHRPFSLSFGADGGNRIVHEMQLFKAFGDVTHTKGYPLGYPHRKYLARFDAGIGNIFVEIHTLVTIRILRR